VNEETFLLNGESVVHESAQWRSLDGT